MTYARPLRQTFENSNNLQILIVSSFRLIPYICLLFREEVVNAVSIQRERFQLAGPVKSKARECCDLVILSLYVFIPPSRGLEIRTLLIVKDPASMDPTQQRQGNLLIMREGQLTLKFNEFKTRKLHGREELSLPVRTNYR